MFKPRSRSVRFMLLALALGLIGCRAPMPAADAERATSPDAAQMEREAVHADLVSAGLGLDDLRASRPEPADAANPTPEELRRVAFHTQFNSLSALNLDGGLGDFSEQGLPVVAGTEIMTWRPVADTPHTARALLQIPDAFDASRACLVVAPASGSRGVYGAVPLVAPWALPKGCAVVYSDKGAGTDYFDLATGTGVSLSGQRTPVGEATLGFVPDNIDRQADAVAVPHAHSGTHVEAEWGRITLDATRWAMDRLNRSGVSGRQDVTVIAAGLSNGGHAVLRALEADTDGLFDAVVSVMPNITPPDTPHLYEYAAAAALYQPCMLGDAEFASALPFANPLLIGFGPRRCQSLFDAGLLEAPSPAAAGDKLREFGFDDDALMFSAATVVLDVWRAVLVNYASAYSRATYDAMPCGYGFDASGATDQQKSLWWATGSGSPPGDGIKLTDTQAAGQTTDPHFPGLVCLSERVGDETVQGAIDETRATAKWSRDIPVFIVHGQNDGLIPAVFSARPYVEQARANGMRVDYEEIAGAQHFDAFLNLLPGDDRWTPILPHGWEALDRAWDATQESR